VSLDDMVSPRGRPTYGFLLQLKLEGSVAVEGLRFEHDVQTSALSLPELTVGDNRLCYTDASPASRRVRITHQWFERHTWHPPEAPKEAITPPDGGEVEGTRVRFAWNVPADSDGDRIVDYQLELSSHADMRWPLSSNFEKRMSGTPSRGKAEWTVPEIGLLNPATPYYWRVRALDARGVWGPWSRTFTFRARAPGVPLDVRLVPEAGGRCALQWRPNPQGSPPVAYHVYGSDEKGFSISDTEYRVFRGRGFVRTAAQYAAKPDDAPDVGLAVTPSNRIAQTEDTQYAVIGPDREEPNTNTAYYRVVALDDRGNVSGPSDYAEAPRPLVYSQPGPGSVGAAYQYDPRVIRSLGDLRCRATPVSSYNAAFWDHETLAFRAIALPAGLSLDGVTGRIAGIPQSAGDHDIEFEVSSSSGKSCITRQRLHVTE